MDATNDDVGAWLRALLKPRPRSAREVLARLEGEAGPPDLKQELRRLIQMLIEETTTRELISDPDETVQAFLSQYPSWRFRPGFTRFSAADETPPNPVRVDQSGGTRVHGVDTGGRIDRGASMTRTEKQQRWSAPTTDHEASSRARGRYRFNVLQRDRAEARRLQVRKRLPALQAEVWAKYPHPLIPRTTADGFLYGSLTKLASELGVGRVTIKKDIQVIEREDGRREQLAPRLLGLREEYGVGRKGRLPKHVVWRLACEYACKPYDIRRDIREIDRTFPYTRPPAQTRGPWDTWAHLRQPRPKRFTRQLCTLFDEETYEKLVATGHPSRIVRQAVDAWLSTGTHHSADDCAMVVVQKCDPDTHSRLLRSALRLELPLWQVLTSLIHVGLRKEA
jgi:hypothetical protein